MNNDLDFTMNNVVSRIESFINSSEGQEIVNQGAGIIARSGDRNYVKAVLIGEALEKAIGAKPTILEKAETGNYLITWEGSELTKGQQYFLGLSSDAVSGTGEPSPVVVDFFPLVRPVALKYGAPTLLGSAVGCALVGYILGRR